MPGSWNELVSALEAGAVEGADGGPFERYETHGSVVLVSANVAYKLKKPVTFDFLDYGTVELRGEMCRTEVVLNRRLAPNVYLGAMPLCATAGGYRLGAIDDPAVEAVEWLVAMRPIARREMLDHRVDHGLATVAELARVGEAVGAFHLSADPTDPALASPEALSRRLAGHVRTLREVGAEIIEATSLDATRRFVQAWIDRYGDRLVERAIAGWTRDGHGDLRLEHVVVSDAGIEVIDCVEFDPALRCGDVLWDLAFLVMELELAGRDELVKALTGAWSAAGGPLDEDALWLFAALKALVRGEVAVHRAVQLPSGYRRYVVTDLARTHLALARRLAWRAHGPVAVVVGGLSGSGKTAVTARLAEAWGLERVASDEIRKRLVGVGRDELAPGHAYADQMSELVYEQLGRAAATALREGRSIVVDATFRREADRRRFHDALRDFEGAAPLAMFELVADPTVLERRVTERAQRGGSDADATVLAEQVAESGRVDDPLMPGVVRIDAEQSLDGVAAAIERAVLDRPVAAERVT